MERHLLTMEPEEWVPPKHRRSKTAGGLSLAEYAPGAVERRRVKGEPFRPPHLRLLVMFAAWCGLRYGELAELRRHDVDLGAKSSCAQPGTLKGHNSIIAQLVPPGQPPSRA